MQDQLNFRSQPAALQAISARTAVDAVLASDYDTSMRLRDQADMSVIESVRPANPSGWVLTVGGRDLVLSEREALVWLAAVDAYQIMEEREQSVPDDSPYWKWADIDGGDGD
jgi:hypothetical protein